MSRDSELVNAGFQGLWHPPAFLPNGCVSIVSSWERVPLSFELRQHTARWEAHPTAQKSFQSALLDLSSAGNFREVASTAVHLDPLLRRSATTPVGDENWHRYRVRTQHSS